MMPARKPFQIQKSRVPVIATTLVLLGGFVTCLAISVPFSDNLTQPTLWTVVLFGGIALLLALLRLPVEHFLGEWAEWRAAKKQKTVTYKLKRIRPLEQTTPQQPPTAESIRELREQHRPLQ